MTNISLPTTHGGVEKFEEPEDRPIFGVPKPFRSRRLFAAPHVVADAQGSYTPGIDGRIDVEKTLAYRRFLWSHGLGVAEAMSTTERSAIRWEEMKRLIEATAKEAGKVGGELICGIDTDQYDLTELKELKAVAGAYLEQLEFVESLGVQAVIRCSRHLVRVATTAADYAFVYRAIIERAAGPVFIHWSGAAFQPLFASYWGSADPTVALESLLRLVHESDGKVTGLKISLLQPEIERQVRRRLPEWCHIFTGDDYNYDSLLMPDPQDGSYSDGLLGILDVIAPLAAEAIALLDGGDDAGARRLLSRSIPLAKVIFEHPAGRYTCGIVFLAYLNGFQDHFRMVSGSEGLRSIMHYAEVFRQAAASGVLRDWNLAVSRFRPILEAAGVAQKG
jgi:Protein of unknown function (DUF993)